MNISESLTMLKESVSEETYTDIIRLVEGSLFKADKRGDLLDDISKALTGKTLGDHLRHGAKKLAKGATEKVKDKVLKSKLVKNTIGKNEYKKAYKDLELAQLDHDFAKQAARYSSDNPAKQREYREDAKHYDKEARQKAKRVSEIKSKYGLY